mgnify:CR=1 FL=1
MGNLHLVTGYAGAPHVASADQGSLYEGLIRGGQFVMDAGANFAASIVSNNQIRVNDGELMIQGRYVRLAPGSYVDLMIENGTQGYRRTDLIVARYTRNAGTGIEECSLAVIKGTPSENTSADPQYTTGIINADGALQHDFPLYKVALSGLSVEGITALFEPQKSLFDSLLRLIGGTMAGNIAMAGHKVTGLGTPNADGDAVPLKYATENFAPSGYGLGEKPTKIEWSEVDNLHTNGWYYAIVNGEIAYGIHVYSVCIRVDSYDSNNTHHTIYNSANNSIIHRHCRQGVWGAYQVENPPLIYGGEYLTTDRYQGSDVWKKVDAAGNILWKKDGESQWHLLSSASYVSAATVE